MNFIKKIISLSLLLSGYLFAGSFTKIEHAIFNKHKQVISSTFIKNSERLINTLSKKGYWSDINYDDHSRTNWEPQKHYQRLEKLAKAYATKESPFYQDKKLENSFINALSFYFEKRSKSTNWWLEDLNEPQYILRSIIIFKQAAPQSKRLSSIEKKYLD